LERFAFIDTETTGLVGGTGTYTFLVGLGRFEGDEFRLVQFFLQEPGEEPAQLAAIEEFLAPCEAVVSFNGKTFDLPLLNTRYITNGWPPPLKDAPHIDLLHLARRLWKLRLPSRTLGDLEAKILGLTRSQQDVPGWMVADLYFDYLHTGDARPLRGVFYHNEMDIVSLAALLNHMASLLENPLSESIQHGLDLLSIGKLYADLGHLDMAAEIYQRGLDHKDIHEEAYWDAIQQLSFIHKKRGDLKLAMELWAKAAAEEQIYAHVELAKVFEHTERDIQSALKWTQEALEIINSPDYPIYERDVWQAELEHRLTRLERKNDSKLRSDQKFPS
jgi:tetratricopeptide (TPR) repeat protein